MRYKEYLDDVCKEVRFKAAHKVLRQELSAHIDDKKQALEASGANDAEAQAIAEMGDAAETGKALSAIHKPRTEWGVIASVVLLSIVGVLILALVSATDIHFGSNTFYLDQLIGVAAGLCIMVGMMFLDYSCLIRFRNVFFISAILLYLVQRFIIAIQINGAFFSFSSTGILIGTLIPILFLLAIVGYIQSYNGSGIAGLMKIGLLCVVSAFFVMLTYNIVSFCTIQLVYLVVLLSGIKVGQFAAKRLALQYLIVFGIVVAAMIITILLVSPATGWISRLLARLSIGGYYNADAEGYAVSQAREMLQSSKFIGSSDYYLANQSRLMPYCRTSYMFTCIIGIYGWLAGIGIMLVFGVLFTILIIRSTKITHSFGKSLSTATSLFLLIKYVANTALGLGLIGGLDVNMPFISHGRIDYIINAFLIGIFLSAWRRSTFMSKDTEMQTKLFRQKS